MQVRSDRQSGHMVMNAPEQGSSSQQQGCSQHKCMPKITTALSREKDRILHDGSLEIVRYHLSEKGEAIRIDSEKKGYLQHY